MKTKILIICLLLISASGIAQRQPDPKMFEQIKARKVAFITEEIGLTSIEAEKFWPIYNELEKQRIALMINRRALEHKSESPKPEMNDADYRKLATELATNQAKDGNLSEEYNLKFLDILPAEKVVKLYRAEGKFRATLMHEFRQGHDEKREKEGNK
jgi:hypothetical protein